MTLSSNRLLLALCLVCFAASSLAIIDLSPTTRKPPKRHESVLPWRSAEDDSSEDPSRSAKWHADELATRKPLVVYADTKSWRPWRKHPNSDIEQRSEVDVTKGEGQVHQEQGHANFNRRNATEGAQSFEGHRISQSKDTQQNVQQNQDFPSGENKEYGAYGDRQESIFGWNDNLSSKLPKDGKGNSLYVELETDQDFYEGIGSDTTKPHKEKILSSKKPKSTVAVYDSRLGVQCPDVKATGQFVYPPDCKFFVNCWKGRAFVQPCAPGTLFSPDTLECDFPHKVNCYGGEIAEFSSSGHLESSGRREPLSGALIQSESAKIQEPRCPPDVTALLPHPWDCTKFLQCANGATFIMDCGPGTVFNPVISVCDWPYNVRGCEDALKTETETRNPLGPPHPNSYNNGYDHNARSEYREPAAVAKKIACPAQFTGQLPHPETCKKFLQCTNGGTFVMDCGPGTAFNPETKVCDWPHKVPGCSEKTGPKQNPQNPTPQNTGRPWPPRGSGNSGSWQDSRRYNQTHPHPGAGSWQGGNSQPEVGPPSPRPTWRPNYPDQGQAEGQGWHDNSGHEAGHHNRYQIDSMQPPGHSRWTPPPPWSDSQHPGYQHGNQQGNRPWPQEPGRFEQNQPSDRGQYDAYGPYGCNGRPCEYPPYQGPPPRMDGPPGHNWHHPHGQGHQQRPHTRPWHYPNYPYPQGAEVPIQQVPYEPSLPGPVPGRIDGNQWNQPYPSQGNDGTRFGQPESPPDHRRTGQDFIPNRQDHGRTGPGFSQIDNRGTLPNGSPSYNQTWQPSSWNPFLRNTTNWNQSMMPIPQPGLFRPSTWNGQPEQVPSTNQPQGQSWNQGVIDAEDKFREWQSSTNVYQQSTVDKEAEAKLDQWASKTNVFQQAKGKVRPESQTEVPDTQAPQYPQGIFVNVNGTRFHYITKDIKIDQGHSKTRTYNRDDLQAPRTINGTYGNAHMPFQPPVNYPTPNNPFSTPSNSPDRTGAYQPSNQQTNDPYSSPVFRPESLDSFNAPNFTVPKPYLQPPLPPLRPVPFNRTLHSSSPASNLTCIDTSRYRLVPCSQLSSGGNSPVVQPGSADSANRNRTIWRHPPLPYNRSTDLEGPGFDDQQTAANYHPPVLQVEPPQANSLNRPHGQTNFNRNISADRGYPSRPVLPSIYLEPPNRSPDTSSSDQLSVGTYNSFSSEPTTTEKPPDKFLRIPLRRVSYGVSQTPEVPTVSIENQPQSNDNEKRKTKKAKDLEGGFPDVLEPDLDKYEVDLLDEKENWKPKLVFENKTNDKPRNDNSVIMKIDKKTTDVDIFNVEAAPLQQAEIPFPAYYVAPVKPLSELRNAEPLTPISGQIIRLRGGSGPHDGYLEAQGVEPGWGIVCDSRNSWTLKEAHIVCRQLGYSKGADMAWQGRNNRSSVPTWIAANSVICHGNETRFQSCKFTHNQSCRVERDAVGVRCLQNNIAYCSGKDEVPYEGQCYHKASSEAASNHAEASDYCADRGSRLIDITNQAENNFISEWLIQKHPKVESIMTSGVGITAMNRTLWMWEDSIAAKFKFTKWWPGWKEDKKHPPWIGSRPNCIVMSRKFPCHNRPDSTCLTDYLFWDVEDCTASRKGHAFFCKRPYNDIGCVYGKGNQYSGNANMTASGLECLPWGDQRIAHPLNVYVVNREVKEKLKTHNYCRNPNPLKESRPWCFVGTRGERDYCDIPSCGKIEAKKSALTGQCKPKHFECLPGECIPSPWVCDGEEDCTNGADERACTSQLHLFEKSSRHKLEGYEVEKWLNTPLKTCAIRCKDADFTCRSFTHKSDDNVCLLSDSNLGMTGALKPDKNYDYYEIKERSINCDKMFVCENKKCINQTQVCNGKNDCGDRSDEALCTKENLDYDIRLAGSNNTHEGRVEVKVLGYWGQVCDDGFDTIDADVICKELGFTLGALEVRPGGFYGNLDPPTRFMVDQLKCRGNEKSLRECDFEGWGVHDCQPEEAAGIVCKTAVDSCQEGHWKCDKSPACIPTPFICDEVVDCPDGSDESSEHCDAPFELRLANGSSPLQGRVEVRHHGVWGTVCDDDFSNATATVICRSLGYGGPAIAKKNGFYGPGQGPIWLDEVFCHGNETQLYRCEHNHWGQHNCDHNEDAGVICTPGNVNDSEFTWEAAPAVPEVDINDLLPADCGKQPKDFNDDEDLIFAKVVHGSIARKGSYPWQASIRVRGHSRSSHWCGAVILSPLHVLTAAHCLEGYNKGTYFVRAGDYNTEIDEGTEAEANIEDYYVHEEFRQGHRMNNDIALVLLKGRGIPLGKHIMPICLPAENAEYQPGLNCTISGFGSIETGKSTQSRDLRYGWIPLLDQSICRADYVYGEKAISNGMVCAGFLDEGVDSCDGDSGGPLACYHNGAFTLYGITSWGQHCGKANKPGVYVRVSHYRPWIDRKIRESLAGR